VILTPLVRRWALARGFVDQPGERKIHRQPQALGGGIVIFWVTLLPMAAALLAAGVWGKYGTPQWIPEALAQHVTGLLSRTPMVVSLLLAATMLHGLGLVDDRRHLGPGVKLIVQSAAALILVVGGQIRFSLFIPNVYVTTLLTVIWMVLIINAFNFLDNMDGLSAGIGAICTAMLLGAALGSGQVFVGAFLALSMGTLAGFLVFNFFPAKIFMGDAGSLLVGMFVAVGTIQTTYYHQEAQNGSGMWFSTFMPLVVLAVPLYDFISVTILRLRQGKSPFVGDQQHFSHRLVARGMSQRQAVLTIYLATAGTGLGATFLNQVSNAGAVLIFIQTVLIVLIIAILEQPVKSK